MMAKPTSEHTAIPANQGIEITPQSDSLWQARVLFPSSDITDREMIFRMREAKQKIAAEFSVPFELLEFREVVDKEQTFSGVVAVVAIGRIAVGKGKTVIHLKDLKAPTGEFYADMLAEMDFYYLDEFDQKVTLERLLAVAEREKIRPDLLNLPALEKALQYVLEKRSYVAKLEIARGKFPDLGRDAELEYTFFTEPGSALDLSEYRNSRKVKTGDILCQKIPPKDGKAPGMNVRGETIPPLKGLDLQLAAGDGAKLSLDGTSLKATREGLAVMTRTMRQVYTAAGKKIIPAKIEVMVKELITLRGDKPITISVDDSVEITGNLQAGSSISSQGEVFLDGDVNTGAQVNAHADVLIKGEIQGAQVSSNSSIIGRKGAKDATLTARNMVELLGIAENSEISAEQVKILQSVGSNIIARYKVQMERAQNDAAGRRTTVRVGKKNYYTAKLKANREAINSLSTSLKRIQEIFGPETLAQVGKENLQLVFLRELENLRSRGYSKLSNDQVQCLKKLLDLVKPLRNVLAEKRDETEILRQKASEDDSDKPVVIIRERIQDPVDVILDEVAASLPPAPQGVVLSITEAGAIDLSLLPETPKDQTPSQ